MSVSRARPSWGHVPGIRPHQGNVCVGDPTKCHHVMQAMYRGFEFDDVCKTYDSEIVPGKRSGTWTLSLCCERRLRTQTLKFKPECLKAQSLQHKYWFSTVHDCVTRSLCSRATPATVRMASNQERRTHASIFSFARCTCCWLACCRAAVPFRSRSQAPTAASARALPSCLSSRATQFTTRAAPQRGQLRRSFAQVAACQWSAICLISHRSGHFPSSSRSWLPRSTSSASTQACRPRARHWCQRAQRMATKRPSASTTSVTFA